MFFERKSIADSISGTIAMWAALLAVYTATALTGLTDVAVSPKVDLLAPTYSIQLRRFEEYLTQRQYSLADSLVSRVFGTKSVIIVDIPNPHVVTLKSGIVLRNTFETKDGIRFTYKDMTNGSRIFRCTEYGYSPDAELLGRTSEYRDTTLTTGASVRLSAEAKRVQLMPFLMRDIVGKFNGHWRFVSTDSLLEIAAEFRQLKRDEPPFMSSALIDCRDVYSFVSIENPTMYEIRDLRLHIYRRNLYSAEELLTVEAWTIEESFPRIKNMGRAGIEIQIDRLTANSDLQIILSGAQTTIEEDDIVFSYNKFSSINKRLVWMVLWVTFGLSFLCRFWWAIVIACRKVGSGLTSVIRSSLS